MSSKFYVNVATGDVTHDRKTAMDWYKSGFSVEVWKRGKRILTLNAIL